MDKHALHAPPSHTSKPPTRLTRSLSATVTATGSTSSNRAPTDSNPPKPPSSSHHQRQSRSVHHHHRHLSRLSSGRHEGGVLADAVAGEGMTDLSRRIGRLREHTPSLHGPGHLHHHHKKGVDNAAVTAAAGLEREREREMSEERLLAEWAVEAARESRRDECRNTEIRSALQGIAEVSIETTRKLDDVYYSVLEKMSNIHATISSLQDLSTLTKSLCHGFESDAANLQSALERQTSAFGGFHSQKSRIESLEWRLKASQDKSAALTVRLQDASTRVQALEDQEAEVQATISMRFRIVWGVLGGAVAVLLALLVLHSVAPATGTASLVRPNATVDDVGVGVEEVLATVPRARGRERPASLASLSWSTSPATSPPALEEEDPRLRLFEEL